MSRIAVIGTGNVGSALGAAFARAGHEVSFGARSPDSGDVRAVVERAPGSRAVAVPDAAADAEIVVLAVPWEAVPSCVAQLGGLPGRIVVDATNPLRADLSGLSVQGDSSAGEQVAAMLPGARVVKAFNTTGASNLGAAGYQAGPLAMLVAGEDADAKAVVCALARDIGFDAADAGGIERSRRLEALAMLWIGLAYDDGWGTDFGFAIHRR